MRRARVFLIAAIATTLLSADQQASAQYTDNLGVPWSNPISAAMSTMIWGKINEMTQYGPANKRSGGNRTSSRTTTPTKPEVVPEYRLYRPVKFKPTGTRLKLQEFADFLGGDPKEKAEMKRVLNGILDKYEASAAAKGYPNDLALAYVSYIGLNSHVYHERTEEPLLPFEQNIGLRDVLAEEAVDHGSFANMTDRQKQEVYEVLVMSGGITYYFYEEARKKNNVEELKLCKRIAERNLKILGIVP